MKTRLAQFILLMFLAVSAAIIPAFFFLKQSDLSFKEKDGAVSDSNCVRGQAGPASAGHFVTDIIEYKVEVVYCAKARINEGHLANALDLSPLEQVKRVRFQTENLSEGVHRLVLTYTVQAIEVLPGKLYNFKPIPVEYRINIQGQETERVYWIEEVEPVYISRMTSLEDLASEKNLSFRPLKPEASVQQKELISQRAMLIIGAAVSALGLAGIGSHFFLARKKKIVVQPSSQLARKLEALRVLEKIKLEAKDNPRRAAHWLYNIALEIENDLSIDSGDLAERASRLAYSTKLPSREEVEELAKRQCALVRNINFEEGGDA